MNENTRRVPFFTLLRTKSPSIPVTVRLVVPLATTDTPISGSPFGSATTPLQAADCWAQWKFSGDKHKSLQVDTEKTFHQRCPLVML